MTEADLGNVFFEVAHPTVINHLIIAMDLNNFSVNYTLEMGIKRAKRTLLTYAASIPVTLPELLPPIISTAGKNPRQTSGGGYFQSGICDHSVTRVDGTLVFFDGKNVPHYKSLEPLRSENSVNATKTSFTLTVTDMHKSEDGKVDFILSLMEDVLSSVHIAPFLFEDVAIGDIIGITLRGETGKDGAVEDSVDRTHTIDADNSEQNPYKAVGTKNGKIVEEKSITSQKTVLFPACRIQSRDIGNSDFFVMTTILDSVVPSSQTIVEHFNALSRIEEGYVKVSKLPQESWSLRRTATNSKTQAFSQTTRWVLGSFALFAGTATKEQIINCQSLNDILPLSLSHYVFNLKIADIPPDALDVVYDQFRLHGIDEKSSKAVGPMMNALFTLLDGILQLSGASSNSQYLRQYFDRSVYSRQQTETILAGISTTQTISMDGIVSATGDSVVDTAGDGGDPKAVGEYGYIDRGILTTQFNGFEVEMVSQSTAASSSTSASTNRETFVAGLMLKTSKAGKNGVNWPVLRYEAGTGVIQFNGAVFDTKSVEAAPKGNVLCDAVGDVVSIFVQGLDDSKLFQEKQVNIVVCKNYKKIFSRSFKLLAQSYGFVPFVLVKKSDVRVKVLNYISSASIRSLSISANNGREIYEMDVGKDGRVVNNSHHGENS